MSTEAALYSLLPARCPVANSMALYTTQLLLSVWDEALSRCPCHEVVVGRLRFNLGNKGPIAIPTKSPSLRDIRAHPFFYSW